MSKLGIAVVLNRYLDRNLPNVDEDLLGSFNVRAKVQVYIVINDQRDIGSDELR